MNFFDIIEDNPWIMKLLYSILVVVIGFLIYRLTTRVFVSKIESRKNNLLSGKRSKTYIKLIDSTLKYLFFFIEVVIILNIYGVDITSMIAGVGVASVIIAFAIQDALKDIIKGIDIISDGYYQVGDVIKYDKFTGKVISIGIKTTKLEDIYTMNIVSISNRNIDKVEIVSKLIDINIPLPYELKIKKAEEVINHVLKKIEELPNVEKVEYKGVDELASSSINYRIKVFCNPYVKIQVRRDALTCIVKGLEEKHISVPYNQIDVHQKK